MLITEDQNLITKMIACQCEAYMFEEFRQLLRFAPAPVQTCDPAAASVSTPGSATRRQSSVIERNNQDTYQLPISESQSLQTNLAPKTVQPNNEGKVSRGDDSATFWAFFLLSGSFTLQFKCLSGYSLSQLS